jgi:hypothetical protein
LHALGQVFVVLGELDFDVELTRGFLNLGREEQVVDEGKDARGGIFAECGQRLGINRRKWRGEAGTLTARSLTVVAIAGQGGTIAVIHGGGVNAILIVARLAGAAGGAGPAGIVGATSTTPPASASATGGSS